jgi:hypothetical protein
VLRSPLGLAVGELVGRSHEVHGTEAAHALLGGGLFERDAPLRRIIPASEIGKALGGHPKITSPKQQH